jgi:hypothetical protein
MATWLKEVIPPIAIKMGSKQIMIKPMDNTQITQPDMVPAVARFIISPLRFIDDKYV